MTSLDSETAVDAAPTVSVYNDFYFSDGNIVLDVVEDSATTRFRVHKSLLSRNSLFFTGMFDIPQPPENPSELVDGCPAIKLTGDSAGDWIIIFGALYNVFFNQTQQPISTIIAMLRLGRKYEFPVLEHDARRRLRQWYPSTLQGFRSREQASCPFEMNDSAELLRVVDEDIIPDDVLPVLFYDHLYLLSCLDHPGEDDKPGEDDDISLVNEKMKLRLLVGHRRLLATQYKYSFAFLHSSRPHCRYHTVCENTWRDAERFLYAPESSGNVIVRPFATLELFKSTEISFCHGCRPVAKDALEQGAAEAWRLLPWVFGLGSWEKLIKEPEGKGGMKESDVATNA